MRRRINILNPWVMAAGLLITFLVIYFIHDLIVFMAGNEMDYRNIWTYVMGAMLVYALFSTINLLYARETSKYYYKTLMAFAALLITGGLLATWISGQNILNLETYRKVLIFVIFTFLALVSIASMMKGLENWTKSHDEKFLKNDSDEKE